MPRLHARSTSHGQERLVAKAENVEEGLAWKVEQRVFVQVGHHDGGLERVHVPVQPGAQSINTESRGVHIYLSASCQGRRGRPPGMATGGKSAVRPGTVAARAHVRATKLAKYAAADWRTMAFLLVSYKMDTCGRDARVSVLCACAGVRWCAFARAARALDAHVPRGQGVHRGSRGAGTQSRRPHTACTLTGRSA